MDLSIVQKGIFEDVPQHGRFLFLDLHHEVKEQDVRDCLAALCAQIDGESVVLGLGDATLNAVNATHLESLNFPSYDTRGVQVPSTPAALWLWLRGDDLGEMTLQAQALINALTPVYELADHIDSFKYKDGHDLTGYEDGTENPEGEEAFTAAFSEQPAGASYVAVQQWQHDLAHFKSKNQTEQDHVIGRSLETNEELDDAPESAHVKRTEQEAFDPQTFLLRRSMAYGEGADAGLVFQAFAFSPESYSRIG